MSLPYTGINQSHISDRIQSGVQSIYECQFNKCCTYRSANHGQMANHLRCMHAGVCITCHLCSKRFWAGKGFKDHVSKVHADQVAEWYESEVKLHDVKLEAASKIV